MSEEERSPVTRCPICRVNPMENECRHLFMHGDDLRTREVVCQCASTDDYQRLKSKRSDLPEFATDFFRKFRAEFPNLVAVESAEWCSGPGSGGVYYYVWARNPLKLQNEISDFTERLVKKDVV